jgi:hypothetical protein
MFEGLGSRIARWLNSLISWGAFAAVLGVGVVIGLWHFIYQVPWYGQGLLAFAALILIIRLIKDRKQLVSRLREWADDLRGGPLTEGHTDYLRKIAEKIDSSVQHGKPCDYGSKIAERNFRSHFPGLRKLLDDWGDVRAHELVTKERARQWIGAEVAKSCADPPFLPDSVVACLRGYLDGSLEERFPAVPDPRIWFHAAMSDPAWIYWMDASSTGKPVIHKDADHELTDSYMAELQSLLERFVASSEFEAATRARDDRKNAQTEIAAQLREVRENVNLFGHCGDCRPGRKAALYRATSA